MENPIELTLKSKTRRINGVLLNVAQLVVRKGEFLTYFKNNKNLILSEQVINVITKLRSADDKREILAIDSHRKDKFEEQANCFNGTSSDNLLMGNYNNTAFRMYITHH
jgi:hypothetical protein